MLRRRAKLACGVGPLAISDDVPLMDHEGVPDSDTVLDADGLGVQLALALSLTDVEQLSLAD